METYTFDDIKREVYGERGTSRREKIEQDLTNLRIGLQIRNARKELHLTQKQLAEKIGRERSFISKVETDGVNLTLATLYDIVERGLGKKFSLQFC